MRFPITFKLGIGFLFSGWALSIFLNSQLAVGYYRDMGSNSVTTAFAATIGKINPTLFQIEGFANYYSLTPLLICLATGFILSSIFCWIIESFVLAIFTLVRYFFRKLPFIFDGLQALSRDLRKSESVQTKKACLTNAIRRSVNAWLDDFDRTGLAFASKIFTMLIIVQFVVNGWPSLGERLAGMHIDKWFSPNYGAFYIIKSVLEALFNI